MLKADDLISIRESMFQVYVKGRGLNFFVI